MADPSPMPRRPVDGHAAASASNEGPGRPPAGPPPASSGKATGPGTGLTARRYGAFLAGGALAGFLLIWAWIAWMPLAYLDPEYPFWVAKQRMVRSCDLGELVILGDSRAAAGIMPAGLPLRATNLAVGGGKAVEALALARRVVDCRDPPKYVIISIDFGHFMKPDLFWERSVRFGLMGRADLAELAAVSAATGDWSVHEARQTDALPPAVRAWLYAARFPPYFFNSVLKAGLFLRWWSNATALEQGLAARGHYFFGTDPGSDGVALDARLAGFAPSPVLDALFERLLTLLEARGMTVWFVPMPVNDATWQAMRPEVNAAFLAYLEGRAARHGNVRVMRPAAPHWPNAWFGDAFAHLNPAGAQRFSQDLAACLSGWMTGGPDCTRHTAAVQTAAGGAPVHAPPGPPGTRRVGFRAAGIRPH